MKEGNYKCRKNKFIFYKYLKTNRMRILFCDSVLDRKAVEPAYDEEMQCAVENGFVTSLFSFEERCAGDVSSALKYISPLDEMELALYRGWMLTPLEYERLYEALIQKNIQLVNNPEAYKHCHYLPFSYHQIASKTPQSKWSTNLEDKSIQALAEFFGSKPIIVKDYVKSEKHHWEEACYIPDASDFNHVKSVVSQFIQLRGDSLNEGIVFREFEDLTFLTDHSKSGMPLTKEFRIFFAKGNVVDIFHYWDEGEYGDIQPDLEEFVEIAQRIESQFFSMDVAQKKNGDWIIMELGDGQVAGLPEKANVDVFYRKLKEGFASLA